MKIGKSILRATLLALVMLVLVVGTVLAAYSYYASVQVQETDGNSYSYLPIIVDVDNDYLSDNSYMSLTGLDTRVLSGGTELEHMVADDKTLFVLPSVGANSTSNLRYTLGNTTPLDDFPVVVGYSGYITIPDVAIIIRPDGAGTYTEFEDVVGDTVHWEQVDEVTHDDATTHIGSDVADARDTFSLSSPSLPGGATISKVTVYEWVRREAFGSNDFYIMIRSGSTDSLSDEITGLTSTWVLESWEWATDPDTSAAWTIAGVDALEAGGKVSTGVDITQVYVEVTLSPSLELGNNFEIEQKGYVDTSAGSDKNLVYKEEAFRVYVSAEGSITAIFPGLETYNPDEHVETSSVDGWVRHFDSGGISWASIVGAAGSDYDDSDGSPTGSAEPVGWQCDTSNEYDRLFRSILLFDTSALPDGCTVTSAAISLYGNGKENHGSWTTYINIYSSNPASNTALEDADYATLGTTAFSDSAISYDSWSASSYNDFVLNASGIAAINKTGVSKFGARTTHDATATDPGWTVEGNELSFGFYMAEQGAGYKPKLVINYKTAEVTATGISSGEHTIKTIATGGGTDKLEIWVGDGDGTPTLRQSVDLSGASVTDNSNDWILLQNNVMPYMEFYKHTVSGTLVAWYQPVSMIVGTNLDDREGTDVGEMGTSEEDATITWGSNPTGVGATIGSLISSAQPGISPAGDGEAQEIVPAGRIPAGGVVDTVALQENPFYPIVKLTSDHSGLTEEQIWFGGATFIVFLGMALSFWKIRDHLFIGGIVGLALSGLFVAMLIYPWWVMLVMGFVFLMTLLMERKPVV